MRFVTPSRKDDPDSSPFLKSLLNESGQDLIEYALIAAFIALGTIAAMGSLSNKIANSSIESETVSDLFRGETQAAFRGQCGSLIAFS